MTGRYQCVVCALLVGLALMVTGCVTVPQQEFRSYTASFAETKTVTEQMLIEYDKSKREEAVLKQPAQQEIAAYPFPRAVSLALVPHPFATDPVGKRREALEAVANFNTALISLAEGKKPEEVKNTIDSLAGGLSECANLIGKEMPYVGEVSALATTVVAKLQEAKNKQQFRDALKQGEPIIKHIFTLLSKDAEDLYTVKASQADRRWTRHQDKVASLIRQMKYVARETKMPTDLNLVKQKESLQKEVRIVYDRVGLKDRKFNSDELKMEGAEPLTELRLSQLAQTLEQADDEADKYESVIKEQLAFYTLVGSYGQLLRQTQTSLHAVLLALNSPHDITNQGQELLTFVFEVKRNLAALDTARKTAVK